MKGSGGGYNFNLISEAGQEREEDAKNKEAQHSHNAHAKICTYLDKIIIAYQ